MTDGKRRLAGRYRIDGLLGRGGMSEVYFGYDERLDRPVAIKLLRPPSYVPESPDSPEAVEILDALERDQRRFLREIRMTARLELAGVPAVYDTGVDDLPDGTRQLWLVMQLLRGSTLETLVDGATYSAPDTPSVAWAAAITAQVAAVLADVHRVDIVHRDIKAANILVTDGGLVKVLDFGIAILRGSGALPRLTQVDRTVGTPAYMPPEQWAGQLVTPASDVYSLGCLLFELLTGDVPFFTDGATCRCGSHHLKSAVPPSARPYGEPTVLASSWTRSWRRCWPRTSAEVRPTARRGGVRGAAAARARSGRRPDGGLRTAREPRSDAAVPAAVASCGAGAGRRSGVGERGQLTDAEAGLLLGNARALLDAQQPGRGDQPAGGRASSGRQTPPSRWNCAGRSPPRCSMPASTPAPPRCSMPSAATTGGTFRPLTRWFSTAPTTPATPTLKPASRTRHSPSCGTTSRTRTPAVTPTRRHRSWTPGSSPPNC